MNFSSRACRVDLAVRQGCAKTCMVAMACKAMKRIDLQLTWRRVKLQSIEEFAPMKTAAFLVTAAFCFANLAGVQTASATSGPGCLRVVNIAPGDVLNIRRAANASSRIVGAIDPDNQGIISLRGKCKPLGAAWGSRWCPVAYYSGGPNDPVRGWIKARFVRDSDCP